MNDTPLILVVMPVYNAMPYLRIAIDSILNQTFKEYCLYAIDDGSTDGSAELLQSYDDPRIMVFTQPNSGPGAIMNNGLTFALEQNIPFIARMDADDISHPERLYKQFAHLMGNEKNAACSCNCVYINESGNVIGSSTVPLSNKLIKWELQTGLRGLVNGALMIRTKVLSEIGGYRNQFIQAEDTDLFFRLIGKFHLANLSDFLYQIRLHNPSMSVSQTKLATQYAHYAKDCYHRQKREKPERTFESFLGSIGYWDQISIKREYLLLSLWRRSMTEKSMAPRLLAGILEPKRILARLLRKIERISYPK